MCARVVRIINGKRYLCQSRCFKADLLKARNYFFGLGGRKGIADPSRVGEESFSCLITQAVAQGYYRLPAGCPRGDPAPGLLDCGGLTRRAARSPSKPSLTVGLLPRRDTPKSSPRTIARRVDGRFGCEGRADVGFLGELKKPFSFGFHFLLRPGTVFDVEEFGSVHAFDVQGAFGKKLYSHS